MKLLLFLLIACSLTNLIAPSSALTFHSKKETEATKLLQVSFSEAVCFYTIFSKNSDTSKTPFAISTNNEGIFEKVEIEASIDPTVWRHYLHRRLQPFFDTASVNIPRGIYTVNVRFVVEINGRIWGAVAINDPGYGLAKVSEDAIKGGPRWKPGKIFEGVVRSYHTQPITFIVEAEECEADTIKASMVRP